MWPCGLDADKRSCLFIAQEKFSSPESDQLGQLQSQVNEVKDVMTQNIEKVMERGERLEDLIAQTDDLEAHVSRTHVHMCMPGREKS